VLAELFGVIRVVMETVTTVTATTIWLVDGESDKLYVEHADMNNVVRFSSTLTIRCVRQ